MYGTLLRLYIYIQESELSQSLYIGNMCSIFSRSIYNQSPLLLLLLSYDGRQRDIVSSFSLYSPHFLFDWLSLSILLKSFNKKENKKNSIRRKLEPKIYYIFFLFFFSQKIRNRRVKYRVEEKTWRLKAISIVLSFWAAAAMYLPTYIIRFFYIIKKKN